MEKLIHWKGIIFKQKVLRRVIKNDCNDGINVTKLRKVKLIQQIRNKSTEIDY